MVVPGIEAWERDDSSVQPISLWREQLPEFVPVEVATPQSSSLEV